MAAYVVTFDLLSEGQNYSCLVKHLKSYETYWRLRRTVWIVDAGKSASSIANELRECLSPEDKLFVVGITDEISSVGYDVDAAEWCRTVA